MLILLIDDAAQRGVVAGAEDIDHVDVLVGGERPVGIVFVAANHVEIDVRYGLTERDDGVGHVEVGAEEDALFAVVDDEEDAAFGMDVSFYEGSGGLHDSDGA